MAFCTHCGGEVADGAAACANCGHPQLTTPVKRTEGTAIASLILGIAGFVVCPLVPSIVAIILGTQARAKIRSDPMLDGDGMAKAGVILGWIGVGIAVLAAVAIILALVFVVSGPGIDPAIDFDATAMLR